MTVGGKSETLFYDRIKQLSNSSGYKGTLTTVHGAAGILMLVHRISSDLKSLTASLNTLS